MATTYYTPATGNETCLIAANPAVGLPEYTYTNEQIQQSLVSKIIKTSFGTGKPYPAIQFIDADDVVIKIWAFPNPAVRNTQYNVVNGITTILKPIQLLIGMGLPDTPIDGTTAYHNTAMNGLVNASTTMHLYSSFEDRLLVHGTEFDLLVSGGGYNLLGGITFHNDCVYTSIFL